MRVLLTFGAGTSGFGAPFFAGDSLVTVLVLVLVGATGLGFAGTVGSFGSRLVCKSFFGDCFWVDF